ncbi:MAG TPA: DUF2232 domain-containing protein [Firmicutes bacterium]|jgi:uncharacterized protein YybS (DUF2232 family)|nr:MAG: hypothetical protein AA931_08320 [Peptococcaceae bacterium 1109]HHT74072.1 DUF2232 domain-containing protein [Bacillota bacterium]
MKTRSITEGAMLAAITVLLTVIGEYVGLPALIIPVPLTLLVFRHSYRLGISMSVASAVVASLISGHVLSGVTIVIWGFLGIALGMALREQFSFAKTIAVGVVANIVSLGLQVLFYSLLFGTNLFEDMAKLFTSSFDQAITFYQSMGATSEMLGQLEIMRTTATMVVEWGLPAIILISSVVTTFINMAVVRLILQRMGTQVPWVQPFVYWRLPRWSGLIFLLSLALLSYGRATEGLLYRIGFNLMLMQVPALLVVGIAIAWYFFNRWRVPTVLRLVLVYFIIMGPLFLGVVIAAVVDSIYSLREPAPTE